MKHSIFFLHLLFIYLCPIYIYLWDTETIQIAFVHIYLCAHSPSHLCEIKDTNIWIALCTQCFGTVTLWANSSVINIDMCSNGTTICAEHDTIHSFLSYNIQVYCIETQSSVSINSIDICMCIVYECEWEMRRHISQIDNNRD